MASAKLKPGFYHVEFQDTIWEVPLRYQDLRAIGIGAFGSVWLKWSSQTLYIEQHMLACTQQPSVTIEIMAIWSI